MSQAATEVIEVGYGVQTGKSGRGGLTSPAVVEAIGHLCQRPDRWVSARRMAHLVGRDQDEAQTALETLVVHGIAVCEKPQRGLPLYRIAPTRLVWRLVEAHLLMAA